jgi:hypothetical protein
MCLIAILDNGCFLEYVSDQLKTQEICSIAINKNYNSFKYFPEEYKTLEMCLIAINNNGMMLKYVPDQHKTQEICSIAINKNNSSFEYFPEEHKTLEVCLNAVNNNCNMLEFVPDLLKTKDLCKIAYATDKKTIRFIPDTYIDFIHEIIESTEDECSICYNNEGIWCKLECDHTFHVKCVKSIFFHKTLKKQCPLCRSKIDFKLDL